MKSISCKGLKKQIGELTLGEIAFELEPGYLLGVIGVNGAGKSTLLKCLMGGVKLPETAEITIDGYSIHEEIGQAKSRMAFVLTDCPFAMGLTVMENIKLFSPLYADFDTEGCMQRLMHFDVPQKRPLYRLSKGQQIRFQLAFALSYDAAVYFMDEPSANLDVEFREEFYGIMRDLISDGTKSVIYVTQLVEELDGLADYILWLDQGRQLLYQDMETLQERFTLVTGLKRSIDCIPKSLLVGAQ